jgi:hypothetical protein
MHVQCYPEEVERQMQELYRSLNERDRRRYAAVEASKLGYGGVSYISALLGCDPKTIRRGRHELDDPPDLPPGRVRKKGGTQVLSC